jgi:Flp pilus assembly protein TadG
MNRFANIKSRRLRYLRGDRGQAAVEFALMLPILAAVIWLFAEVGLTYNSYVSLTDATRAGARVAAVSRNTATATQAVKDSAQKLDFTKAGASISVSPDPPGSTGTQVTVTATYPYKLTLLGVTVKSGTLTSSTKERVE